MTIQSTVIPPAVLLPDGREATIRPLEERDRAALAAFGAALPAEDCLYLEEDFQSTETISRLVNASAAENWRQRVVEVEGEIVGYTSVRRLTGWSSHVADITLVIAEKYRRQRLGTALAQAIFEASQELGLRKLMIEMLEEQLAGVAIFARLGFKVEGMLLSHARDRLGKFHNLLVLSYYFN
ncbi:MAG TPA: GNAT family N-acetyltransferase [Roseiflexaceae bacterium]|nr:GNAT family N-acetyltransferase [Roseiflexaceae bacterium]